jgi:hypothetical protein
MNKDILPELKKYQYKRSEVSPFETHNDFLKWADDVAPILSFNDKIHANFKQRRLSADSTNILSPRDYPRNVNACIGIVNEAVQTLEFCSNQQPEKKDHYKEQAAHPDPKVTMKWLWENVPASYIWGFFLLLFFVFSVGIKFADTYLYKSLTVSKTASISTKTSDAAKKE